MSACVEADLTERAEYISYRKLHSYVRYLTLHSIDTWSFLWGPELSLNCTLVVLNETTWGPVTRQTHTGFTAHTHISSTLTRQGNEQTYTFVLDNKNLCPHLSNSVVELSQHSP
jgi:hypothetical protein